MRIDRKKLIFALMCCLLFTGAVSASKIELGFVEVDLESSAENVITRPIPNEQKVVEGPFEAYLKGIGSKKELQIQFQAMDPDVYQLMATHLEIQYCIQSSGEQGQWSEWVYLHQLPLTIQLRDQGAPSPVTPNLMNNSPAQLLLLIRFRVPQAVDISPGVFIGECTLNIL